MLRVFSCVLTLGRKCVLEEGMNMGRFVIEGNFRRGLDGGERDFILFLVLNLFRSIVN